MLNTSVALQRIVLSSFNNRFFKLSMHPKIQKQLGNDYFTKNFYVEEHKTEIRNIHLHIFCLLFKGSRLGFELGLRLVFE